MNKIKIILIIINNNIANESNSNQLMPINIEIMPSNVINSNNNIMSIRTMKINVI